jgi:DNA-binding MarR family transcriptional regulator
MKQAKHRGPSEAVKSAKRYLAANPDITGSELAHKFKIDLSTIYRSSWWKTRKESTK